MSNHRYRLPVSERRCRRSSTTTVGNRVPVDRVTGNSNAQYTTPTPTRLDCRIEFRRRCENLRNSQPATTVSTSLNKFANSEVELRRVGVANAPVGSRRELVANSVDPADATQLDSCVTSASAACIGLNVQPVTAGILHGI